jgi:hypothetical protein
MADPLSVIITILQLTGCVVKYLSDLRDASTACNRILVEISSIAGFLSTLKRLVDEAESGEVWLATVASLNEPNGPLAQFESALTRVRTRLEPVVGLRRAGRAIVWPFSKGEVTDILNTIERQKTIFILAMEDDHM